MVQDIADIVHAIKSEGWSLRTIVTFSLSFMLSAVVCGALTFWAVASNDFSHPTHYAIAIIVWCTVVARDQAALRAIVMIVTKNGTHLPSNPPPLPSLPPPSFAPPSTAPLHEKFKESFGPYPTAMMSAVCFATYFLCAFLRAIRSIYEKHISSQHSCGEAAFYDLIWDTNAIIPRNVIIYGINLFMVLFFTRAWEQYMHHHVGIPQDTSKGMKAVMYSQPVLSSWLYNTLGLTPQWVTWTALYLLLLAIFPINFFVDSNIRRRSMGLPPVSYNVFYMLGSMSMVFGIILTLNVTKEAVLKTGGAAAASISVNVLGIIFTFLAESLTVKAAALGQNGPFMFPLYFGIDLMNVSILLSVELFSFEFIALVLVQEGMGTCASEASVYISYVETRSH